MEPAELVREQREAGTLGAFGGGDEMDLGRDEGRIRGDRERIERFGDDLRRQAGDGEQDTAGAGAGGFGLHGWATDRMDNAVVIVENTARQAHRKLAEAQTR